MRVIAIADVHGAQRVYEWLVRQAEELAVEAIILAGDLLGHPDGFSTVEEAQRVDALRVSRLLGSMGLPVLYIMGNDDLVELDSSFEAVQSIHGRRVRLGRYSFVGYQYSPPFVGGPFEKPEADIAVDVARLSGLLNSATVFVSHSPAAGILDPGADGGRIGSSSLRKILDGNAWRAHIHGHSHGGFGRWGSHFNVAAAGRRRAMVVDLATMQHDVVEPRLEA